MINTTRNAEYMRRVTRDALEASFTTSQLSDIKTIDFNIHLWAKEHTVRDHTVCFLADKEEYALKVKAYYELYDYKCSLFKAFHEEPNKGDHWRLKIEW